MPQVDLGCPFSLNEVLVAARQLLGVNVLSAEIDAALRSSTKRYGKLLRRLSRASDNRDRRNALHHLYTSPSAKLISFILGNRKTKSQLDWAQIKRAACSVHICRPTGDRARATQRLKSSGAFRWTWGFGPLARAAQRLVQDIIFVAVGPSPYEHSRRGRGRETVIREALHGVKYKGVRWFGILDVKDFYPSITREMAKDVLNFLPASIIEATIFIHDDTDITYIPYDKNKCSSAFAIRKGIPQGSLASALVASKVLERHLHTLSARTISAYVDNITIGGKTKDEVQAIIIALATSLEEHPSGSLRLTTEIRRIGDPAMDILGYRIRRRSKTFGGFGRAQFSERSRCGHNANLARKLLLADDSFWETIIDDSCAQWVRSFPSWDTRLRNEDIAVIEAQENLLPLINAAKKAVASEKTKWGSFTDYVAEMTILARRIAAKVPQLKTSSGPVKFELLPSKATPCEIFNALLRHNDKLMSFQ